MDKSDSIKEIASALNKAQAEMSGAKKKGNNPFFKSKYADLNAVVDAVRIPFCDNGLSYSQFPIMEENRVGVETILMHESGEWISNKLLLPCTKQDPQAAGSAITYARRYALQAIAGIPAEDDDGNSATHGSSNPNNGSQRKEQPNWYNGFEADKQNMIAHIQGGGTPQDIIDNLKGQGYDLSNEVIGQIQGLAQC